MADSKSRYEKKSMTRIQFKFHNENDKDVIEKIKSHDNKTDYIRGLVREDIKKEGSDGETTTDNPESDDG